MSTEELKERIRTDDDVLRTLVADYWGEELRPVKNGYICRCHFHPDKNPSFSIFKDNQGYWRFNCFSCGEKGDAISFVQKVENCGFLEALRLLAERFSLSYLLEDEERKPKVKPKNSASKVERDAKVDEGAPVPFDWIATKELYSEVKEYLKSRHIDPELVAGKVFSLKRTKWTEKDYQLGYLLLIPAINPLEGKDEEKKKRNGRVVGARLRNVLGKKPKAKSLKGYSQFPFGLENITEKTEEILIVEGEIDYLTLYAFLRKTGLSEKIAVIGLPFARYRFSEELKELFPNQARILLIPDNDATGKEGAKELATSLFREREVYIGELPSGVKDVNELLDKVGGDYQAFGELLKEIADRAFIKGTFSPISSPRDHLAVAISESTDKEELQRRVIPTGIGWIDQLLNGGIRRGFYGLAGQPAIGKTSFCLALSRHLVNNGIKVLFFSLEMTLEDLTAQLVDWELGIPKFRYLDRKLNEWDIQKIKEALDRPVFNDLRIDDEAESIKDIEERLALFLNEVENQPVVVFVDYLQRVIPRERKKDARLEASSVAYDLKRIANKFQVPIIAISSVSREGYRDSNSKSKKSPLTAFKESGDIEYSLYAGFFLDFPTDEELRSYLALKEWQLPIKVVLVKNRFGRARDRDGNFISKLCYLDFKEGKLCDVEEVGEDAFDF